MVIVPVLKHEPNDDLDGDLFWMDTSEGRVVPVFASEREFQNFGQVCPEELYAGFALSALGFEDLGFDEVGVSLAEQLKASGARLVRDDDPFYAQMILSLAAGLLAYPPISGRETT